MPRYKKLMIQRGVMQKAVAEKVHKTDPRVDTSLMSKFVNGVCLPTPPTLATICKTLACDPLDIYDRDEITLAPPPTIKIEGLDAKMSPAELAAAINHDVRLFMANADNPAPTTEAAKKRERRRVKGLYNLTVEIPRDVAERVFAPEALRKLGYLGKSDFVRQAVAALDARLSTIEAKEKADGAGTPNGNK